jgi:hypothetical protein
MGRIYIDKYTGKLERTDLYFVRLTLKDGTVYENLEPRKLFPITNHTMYITLLDSHEKELGFVRDLEEIDEDSRRALEECFEEYYMIPKILSMINITEKFGVITWTCVTDRGTRSFTIKNRHSDIKMLYDGRVLVRDSNDNRYEIDDVAAMDKKSRKMLENEL